MQDFGKYALKILIDFNTKKNWLEPLKFLLRLLTIFSWYFQKSITF